MAYLVAVRDGKTPPPMPNKYLHYHWRRIMGASPLDAAITSLSVIIQDIEMSELEDKYGQKLNGSNY